MARKTGFVKQTRLNHRETPAFNAAEFALRVERACKLMTEHRLDGLMVCSETNLEYLSGFTSDFPWSSPTRPWYFLLSRAGDATAVIPEIGETHWANSSWCKRIVSWPAPTPENEGLDLIAKTVAGMKRIYGRFGVELGQETRLGMAPGDLFRIRDAIRPFELADCVPVTRALRLVKSKAEHARIRHAVGIATGTFDALPGFVALGDSEREICRKFAATALLLGADKVPFTAIGTGRGGYESVVQGASARRIGKGDILNIDTGVKYAGYYSDFNRNFAFGSAPDDAKRAYELLWRATEAGIEAARPGHTAADVFFAQAKVIEDAGIVLGNVGRFGHGLGKALTEFPSNKPIDATPLVPGMVLTVEPSLMFGKGKIMVHEENLIVTDGKPVLITHRAPRELPEAKL